MADNFVANAGTGGDTFGADDIGGVKFPRLKVIIGADGTNDGDVSSANPLPVTATTLTTIAGAIKAEDVASAGGDPGMVVMGMRQDTPAATSGTDGDYEPLRIKAGKLVVDASLVAVPITDNSGNISIDDGGNSITVDGTVTVQDGGGSISIDDNSGSITVDGTVAVTNGGTFVVQENGAALTSLQLIDDTVIADDAAFTPASTKVVMSGFQADESSTDSVDEGDAGAARMTLDRKVITNPQPHTAGGLTIARDIDLDNSTLTVVKNAPGQLYGLMVCNTGTVTAFVKFYDATSGTLGTGTPVLTIGIPGNTSDDTLLSQMFPMGVLFATGICVGAGTGVADNDNTDPGANVVVANIFYK